MSVAIVEMGHELGWSMEERGQVMAAFFYGYIVSQIPGGWAGKKFGYKNVLTTTATGWCACSQNVSVGICISYLRSHLLHRNAAVGLS